MPELPEAETVARTLYPHIHKCVFKNVELLRPASLHPLSLPLSSLINMRIENVWRRAKMIMLDLVSPSPAVGLPSTLVFHLRMTGRLFTASANSEQGKHTRCVFELEKEDGTSMQLFFDDTRTFGMIFAATQTELEKWDFWKNLGPEPLEITAAEFAGRLRGKRPLKTSLLDQKVIAGIGNIYADEALFASGLSPLRPTDSLSEMENAELLCSLQNVLRLSISQCGSSIRDYRDADGNIGTFQNSFAVYGRGGQPCKKCGNILEKIRIGGRATVYCAHCQR